MNSPTQLPRSFHPHTPSHPKTHRRSNSAPSPIVVRPNSAFSLTEPTLCDISVEITPSSDIAPPPTPVSSKLKPQYSIRRQRPISDTFFEPEIVLGEPKAHVGHPKTRIGQSALKLAAIKERMQRLETTNEKLTQRIQSYKTDTEMLNSSVTYFSSEYYASLLTIRDLRARTRQDAEIMSNQEQQLCQLKKFVGLIVEVGLHEPVLECAQGSVLAGEDFESVLVEAIRLAAARRGSAWSVILSAAAGDAPAETTSTTISEDTFQDRPSTSTVDDLLKNLENGDIPFGRHRSSVSRRLTANNSPARNSLLPSKVVKNSPPRSPFRSPLGKVDVNRKSIKTPTRKPRPTCINEGDVSLSTQKALASLQRILDTFSVDSLGSLGTTTTEGSGAHSDPDSTPSRPSPSATPRLSLRRPTVSEKGTGSPTPPRRRQLAVVASPSPVKARAKASAGGSPVRRLRPIPEVTTPPGSKLRSGWR
ncbi:hypothetical protein FB45DRAFT_183117 [Roridomyces roridus]|uniref:Uncharacterized protein n=1 Tax=Roridomyces roridus TaxID=1738132 RepID=A0AAD7CEA1_9AGAR|nr:hypothetical protein FB45DRAFT_183117 [Roridomyces roridus]